MVGKADNPDTFDKLRRRAEELLKGQSAEGIPGYQGDLLELLQELQVYQTELELQNEDLRGAQQKLSQLHREYEDLYEFAPCGYITLDHQGKVTNCNRSGVFLLGCDRRNLLGKSLSGFISRQSQETYLAALKRAGHTGELQTEELRLTGKNKGPFWVRANIRADWAENGGVAQWRISFTDITDRFLAQQELLESKQELAAIYENAPVVMLVLDPDLRVRKVNRFTSRFFGLPASNMLDKHLGEVLSCGFARNDPRGCGFGLQCKHCTLRNTLFHTFDTGRNTDQAEISLPLSRKGLEQEISFLASVSLFYHNSQSRALLTIMDITERVRAEDKLRYTSFHDTLTGLYNRNFFQEEMNRLQSDRCQSMGVMVCDLDGMKFVNDALGHGKGDEMLKRAAELLQENFRASDIIARIGGDEFAVFVPEVDQEGAERLANRLKRSARANNRTDPAVPISLSIGYAVNRERPADMDTLFREADSNMYWDKVQREQIARSEIVQALMRALEKRDFIHQGHAERLQRIMEAMARSLGLSEGFLENLRLLARYHDMGKVAVPEHILFKQGPLSRLEKREIRQHCEIGSRIAKAVPELAPIADWILKHHERWDGTGYPLGLSGDDIPLACRLLALADAYDAMVNDRPSGKALLPEEAISRIRRNAGFQFDPVLAEKFISAVWQLQAS